MPSSMTIHLPVIFINQKTTGESKTMTISSRTYHMGRLMGYGKPDEPEVSSPDITKIPSFG